MLNNKIISIQVLRAIACLLVVQVHLFLHIPLINRDLCGAIGVDIFFIISGFIISASIDFLPSTQSVTTFFINRFSRVVPYYYLLTLLFIGFSYLLGNTFGFGQIIKSLLFIPQYNDPVLFLGWSLNHEILFYGFVGLAFLVFKNNHLKIAISFFVFVTIFHFFPANNYIICFLGANINYNFLLGFLLYRYQSIVLGAFKNRWTIALSVACILVTTAFTQDYGGNKAITSGLHTYKRDTIFIPCYAYYLPRVLIWGIPSFLLVVSFIGLEQKFKKLSGSVLVKIGDASYSIYLVEIFFWTVMRKYNLNTSITHFLLVAGVILTGLFMNKIENNIGNFFKIVLKSIFIKSTSKPI